MAETTAARIIERVVIAKYDGDPPTPGHPKAPVEIVVIDRRGDGHAETNEGEEGQP